MPLKIKSKMTAKEFVLIHRPKMRSEKQKIVGFNARTYWLIRELGNSMYFSEGTTESKAWKSAKQTILNHKIKTKSCSTST